jgi:hypothetical protein
MPQIETDFEVFKALTAVRSAKEETYNEVLRSMLKLSHLPDAAKHAVTGKPSVVSDTCFPAGSEFMKVYKGKTFRVVENGELRLTDGFTFASPSMAAIHKQAGIATAGVSGNAGSLELLSSSNSSASAARPISRRVTQVSTLRPGTPRIPSSRSTADSPRPIARVD